MQVFIQIMYSFLNWFNYIKVKIMKIFSTFL